MHGRGLRDRAQKAGTGEAEEAKKCETKDVTAAAGCPYNTSQAQGMAGVTVMEGPRHSLSRLQRYMYSSDRRGDGSNRR